MLDTLPLTGHALYLALAFGSSLALLAFELAALRRRAHAARLGR